MSIKARQAAQVVNDRLRPLDDTQRIENAVDRIQFDIEIQTLEGPWRWSETVRRDSSEGDLHYGMVEDLIYSVDPAQLVIPVEVVGEGSARTDLRLVCRGDPCIRVTGSRIEATGTQAEVEAAMASPAAMDELRPDNYLPFAARTQAEQAAIALNELLSLQGAQPVPAPSTPEATP